jgi:hypothetical protein
MFALLKNRDKCHKKTAVLLLPPRLRLRQSSRCFRALTPRGIRLKAQPEITSMNRIPPEQITAICHFILSRADIMAANSRSFDSGDSAIAPNASTASFASALEGTD